MATRSLRFDLHPQCRLCTRPNFDGQVECWTASDNEWQIVCDLRARGLHVHTDVSIGFSADIVLPFPRIVAEYDSFVYHEESAERDEEQRRIAIAAGYRVSRLREPGLPLAHPDDLALLGAARSGGPVLEQIAAHLLSLVGAPAA